MGLERLLVDLYGTTPQIDLDQQVARARVPKPMSFDFARVARGVIENNMGLGGIRVTVEAALADGQVRLGSGQSFPLEGDPPPGLTDRRILRFDVVQPLEPERTKLKLAGE